MQGKDRRQTLQRAIRLFAFISIAFLSYVLIDFSTVDTTATDTETIRVSLPPLALKQAYFFNVKNRQMVIIRHAHKGDPKDFFVAYAVGTNLGCPLQVVDGARLKESCSSAEYDFNGQPMSLDKGFTPLHVPVYNFCDDFSCIKLRL